VKRPDIFTELLMCAEEIERGIIIAESAFDLFGIHTKKIKRHLNDRELSKHHEPSAKST
jgi:hypothetical protein